MVRAMPARSAPFEPRIVGGQPAGVGRADVHRTLLQKPKNGGVVETHLIERQHVSRDPAVRCFGYPLLPQRPFQFLVVQARGVFTDDLEVSALQFRGAAELIAANVTAATQSAMRPYMVMTSVLPVS